MMTDEAQAKNRRRRSPRGSTNRDEHHTGEKGTSPQAPHQAPQHTPSGPRHCSHRLPPAHTATASHRPALTRPSQAGLRSSGQTPPGTQLHPAHTTTHCWMLQANTGLHKLTPVQYCQKKSTGKSHYPDTNSRIVTNSLLQGWYKTPIKPGQKVKTFLLEICQS